MIELAKFHYTLHENSLYRLTIPPEEDYRHMKKKYLYLLSIFISFIFSLFVLNLRINVDGSDKTYEVLFDYEDAELMAEQLDLPVQTVLSNLKKAGVSRILLREEKLSSLQTVSAFDADIRYAGDHMNVFADKKGLDFIYEGYRRLSPQRRIEKFSDHLFIEGRSTDFYTFQRTSKMTVPTRNQHSKLETFGLGFREEVLQNVLQAELPYSLMPYFASEFEDDEATLERIGNYCDRYPDQNYMMFESPAIPRGTSSFLKERGLVLAVMESGVQRAHIVQEGQEETAQDLNYQVLRAFNTWPYIQARFDYNMPMHRHGEEITNVYYRAISERNIRLILYRPLYDNAGRMVDDFDLYGKILNDLENRLSKFHGIVRNPEPQMKPAIVYRIDHRYKAISAIGVLAAWALLLSLCFGDKKGFFFLFLFGSLCSVVVFLLRWSPSLFSKLFALGAAVVFPTISGFFLLDAVFHERQKNPILQSIVLLLKTSLITIIGGLIMTTFYAENVYRMEFDFFKGVKIALLLPMLLTGAICLLNIERKKNGSADAVAPAERIRSFLEQKIKVRHILLIGIFLGILGLLLIRSGHESGFSPQKLELLFRNLLERYIPARPRTKTILFGFPAIILMSFLRVRKKGSTFYPFLAIAASIGFTGVMNSFAHIRTPILVTLQRYVFEIGISLLVSSVYISFIAIIFRIAEKRKPIKMQG